MGEQKSGLTKKKQKKKNCAWPEDTSPELQSPKVFLMPSDTFLTFSLGWTRDFVAFSPFSEKLFFC